MFELKKIVSALLMPLPAMLILGLFGLLLLWFTRRKGLATFFISFAFLGIFLVSFQPIATSLLRPLEKAYPPYVPSGQSVGYVMVLGSGHVIDHAMPITSQLSRTALMRLNEGVRIHRLFPGSKLILSGYGGGTDISQARMMAKVALALGVNKNDILLLETAKDTWEEAFQAASVVGDDKLVVVTSASHMTRAMEEFFRVGLTPTAAPTNFLASNKIEQPWERYRPQAKYLEQTERYWHETLGRWWQQIRTLSGEGSDQHTVAQ
ncbi:envelope biogenesis factor ElyC [Photobacterium sp. DNB23_23_1]|uniref:Envelope biogenesis factor ElyC n=1 Tax=Photobacterium pectinilyticum TaxID=2906793 RepID=A0ABT1MXW0_9GAMM|nr:envelope biogenesis factor ElyC [Photobacterium sp. ZSDE20]MCQ1057300.1 envelope biogenesis factor ElyC [Photobacterium sp. ZSDE20]MDD1821759.1 envelope biogenesis factor ElyC [Photobacterium sp. ZSDE20]